MTTDRVVSVGVCSCVCVGVGECGCVGCVCRCVWL